MKNTMLMLFIGIFYSTITFAASYDAKVYPATLCTSDSNALTIGADGHVYNNSSDAISIACPIVKDTVASTILEEVSGYLINKSSTISSACYLVHSDSTGQNVESVFIGAAYGNLNSVQKISKKNNATNGLRAKGSMVLNCVLAPNSYITQYYIEEQW